MKAIGETFQSKVLLVVVTVVTFIHFDEFPVTLGVISDELVMLINM